MNPNLLDNPDFKINQRGKTSYTSGGYTADRWFINNGSTLEFTENGVKITAISISQLHWIRQFNEIPWSQLANSDKFTLTVKFRASRSNLQLRIHENQVSSISDTEWTTVSVQLDSDFSKLSRVEVITTDKGAQPNDWVEIAWVKLETGDRPTPFVPPNPAAELLKCKRYYQLFGGSELSYLNTDRISIRGQLPVPMRITPTVKLLPNISSVHVYDGLDAGLDITVSGTGGCILDNSYVRFIDISFTDLNSNPRWVILDTAPLVELSADLQY